MKAIRKGDSEQLGGCVDDLGDERDPWQCAFPGQCVNPHIEHQTSECATVEMMEAWEAEQREQPGDDASEQLVSSLERQGYIVLHPREVNRLIYAGSNEAVGRAFFARVLRTFRSSPLLCEAAGIVVEADLGELEDIQLGEDLDDTEADSPKRRRMRRV